MIDIQMAIVNMLAAESPQENVRDRDLLILQGRHPELDRVLSELQYRRDSEGERDKYRDYDDLVESEEDARRELSDAQGIIEEVQYAAKVAITLGEGVDWDDVGPTYLDGLETIFDKIVAFNKGEKE